MKTVIEFGDPILRQECDLIAESDISSSVTQDLVDDLIETCDANPLGVGIAAPQIGVSKSIFIIRTKPTESSPDLPARTRICINPEILEYTGDTVQLWDGCLSSGVKPMFAKTKRYKTVKVRYINREGKVITEKLSGFMAHVFQHEFDHIKGVLFVDRITDPKTWTSFNNYKKRKG